MQRIINYGSFLQAYGLKKTIESIDKSNKVEFIDYKFEKSIIKKTNKDTLFYKIISHYNVPLYLNNKKYHNVLSKKYKEFLKMINISEKNYNKNIDTLVIGSDEVFNCLQPYPVGYSRNLFGYEYEKKKVISYAACFGHTSLPALKEYKIDKEIGKMLKKFNAISVRDENSYKIVKELTGKNPELNLDPVLISNYDEELKENAINEKNYILIYVYPNRLNKKEQKYIKKFVKKYNKKIISIGSYQKIADKSIIANPFEVLNYFKNADYVITDTFHGTVFSIKMNTKFCTIIRKSNYNKLSFLLQKLKQEDRMVKELDDIEKLYNKEIDFKESNKVIENETRKSIKYLKENI